MKSSDKEDDTTMAADTGHHAESAAAAAAAAAATKSKKDARAKNAGENVHYGGDNINLKDVDVMRSFLSGVKNACLKLQKERIE